MTLGGRRARWVLTVGLAGATLSFRARAEESAQGRGVEAVVPRPSEPLLTRVQTGGLLLFGVSYGLALGVPAVSGFSESREWFAIPVAGPVIGMARGAPLDAWPIVLDEIGQVGGLTLLIAGDSVSWGSSATVARCRQGGVCLGVRGFF